MSVEEIVMQKGFSLYGVYRRINKKEDFAKIEALKQELSSKKEETEQHYEKSLAETDNTF